MRVLGLNASSVDFWLTSDSAKDLPHSFTLLVNARVFGVQVGSVSIDPMRNGAVTMPLLAAIGGSVDGRIDDWGAFDKSGKPVAATADPHWKTADAVGFLITGVADVTIPASAVIALIPGIGWLAKLALTTLGNKVKITVAHERVLAHLPHGSAESVAAAPSPANAVTAQ